MSIEIEQIRIDDINKDSRLNVLKWMKRPDLIAVARIMDTSANLVGLNMYNYKTKKTCIHHTTFVIHQNKHVF